MSVWAVVLVAALLLGTTALGLVWRARTGRAHTQSGEQLQLDGVELGSDATLLQFSSEVCAPCRSTARILHEFDDANLVRHIEFDVTEHRDLVSRFNILQTPTTLILDRAGAVRSRIGGAVRREVVIDELAKVMA